MIPILGDDNVRSLVFCIGVSSTTIDDLTATVLIALYIYWLLLDHGYLLLQCLHLSITPTSRGSEKFGKVELLPVLELDDGDAAALFLLQVLQMKLLVVVHDDAGHAA